MRPSRRRIGEFLVDEWLPAVRHVLKPSTHASYEDYTRGYVVPVIGAVRLQHDLTARRLNAFYEHLLTRGRVKRDGGLSPKTVRNVHVMLHKALADAVSWRYVAENVAEHAKPPRAGRRQASVWSPEQVRRFLERTRDDRFYALYLLAAPPACDGPSCAGCGGPSGLRQLLGVDRRHPGRGARVRRVQRRQDGQQQTLARGGPSHTRRLAGPARGSGAGAVVLRPRLPRR